MTPERGGGGWGPPFASHIHFPRAFSPLNGGLNPTL